MEKKKSLPYGIIAGVLFIPTVVYSVHLFGNFTFFTSSVIGMIVTYLGTVLVVVSLFRQKHDILPVIGLGLFAICSVFSSTLSSLLADSRSVFSIVGGFIGILHGLSILFMVVVMCTNLFPQCRKLIKRFWFVPAVLITIRCLLYAIWDTMSPLLSILFELVCICAMLFTGLWAISPDPVSTPKSGVAGKNTDYGYCDLAKHVLLLIFTFGIWYLIWIYRSTDWLNRVKDEPPRNPTTKLLLCMFVPFYSIYWVYQSARRIDKLAVEKGISSDIATPCLILAIFVGIIPPILMQSKINAIVMAGNESPQNMPSTQPAFVTSQTGTANEIKAYKELLDSGAISQEEYDEKKKQLLGL